jgi:hypothetical protein
MKMDMGVKLRRRVDTALSNIDFCQGCIQDRKRTIAKELKKYDKAVADLAIWERNNAKTTHK